MHIEGSYKFNAARDTVYRLMTDPEYVSKAVPGCESLTPLGNDLYDMTVKIGIASIKGTYSGKIQFSDKIIPESCKMMGEGSSFIGAAKGNGTIRLEEDGNNTNVFYSGDVQVSGKIAAVGSRFLVMTAKMIIGKFFSEIAKEIKAFLQSNK